MVYVTVLLTQKKKKTLSFFSLFNCSFRRLNCNQFLDGIKFPITILILLSNFFILSNKFSRTTVVTLCEVNEEIQFSCKNEDSEEEIKKKTAVKRD